MQSPRAESESKCQESESTSPESESKCQESEAKSLESEAKCQECDLQNAAVCRCTDCNSYLCQGCLGAHERLALFKSHKVLPLVQPPVSEVADDRNSPRTTLPPKCRWHPEKDLSIYCTTCDLLVCAACALVRHGRHSRCGLGKAVTECRQAVGQLTAEVEGAVEELSAVMTEIGKVQRLLDTLLGEAQNKLSMKANQLVSSVKEAEDNLRLAIEKIYKEKAQILENAQAANCQRLNKVLDELQSLRHQLSDATDIEILNLKMTLSENLREMINTWKEPMRVPKGLLEDFSTRVTSLGSWTLNQNDWTGPQEEEEATPRPNEIPDKQASSRPPRLRAPAAEEPQGQISARQEQPRPAESPGREKWRLVKSIKKFGPNGNFQRAFAVAEFTSCDFVIADTEKKQLGNFAKISEDKSHRSRILATRSFDYTPTHVAVNKDDQVIVLIAPVVKILDKDFQFIRQFLPGTGQSDSTPTCLAVDEDNLIAVGFAEKEEIALHNPDGSLIKMIVALHISSHLSISEKKFLYTNWTRRKIVSVDYNSNLVFNSNLHKSKSGPTGICHCPDGSFYVAVVGSHGQGHIYHSTLDLADLKTIAECSHPYCITLNPNSNQLFVAAGKAVHIYMKCS